MRVLFLSTWCPFPPDNGAKIRANALLRALAAVHEVSLVTFCPNSVPVEQLQSMAPRLSDLRAVPDDPFRYVKEVPLLARYASPTPLWFWRNPAMGRAVAELAASRDFDAGVAIQVPVARYLLEADVLPAVLDLDTALSYQLRERYFGARGAAARWQARVSWRKAEAFESRTFPKFHACTLSSALEYEYVGSLLRGSKTRLELLSNGVDTRRNQPFIGIRQPHHLVFNGALTYSANFDAMKYFLLEIYPLIRQRAPGITLTVTGSTQGVNLGDLPVDDSVSFSGYVEDIRPVVASASACVVPLRQGGGTRLKILEAMALGVPVISTEKGAEGLELVPDQHLLIANTPDAFAEGTLALLNDEAQHDRIVDSARRLVEERYDWSVVSRRFVELVESSCRG